MSLKKSLLGLIIASSFGAVSLPAQSEIIVSVAPPAPRHENVPSPRRGYTWESGYWRWNGHRHVWVAGHWERNRHGYTYNPPRWEERDGRWVYHSRRWDRDGDGVANNRDRRQENPNRS